MGDLEKQYASKKYYDHYISLFELVPEHKSKYPVKNVSGRIPLKTMEAPPKVAFITTAHAEVVASEN